MLKFIFNKFFFKVGGVICMMIFMTTVPSHELFANYAYFGLSIDYSLFWVVLISVILVKWLDTPLLAF